MYQRFSARWIPKIEWHEAEDFPSYRSTVIEIGAMGTVSFEIGAKQDRGGPGRQARPSLKWSDGYAGPGPAPRMLDLAVGVPDALTGSDTWSDRTGGFTQS